MEETHQNKKRRSTNMKRKFDAGDVVTAGFLFSVTVGAFYFPWHVYLNPEQFSPPQMAFSRQDDPDLADVEMLAANPGVFDIALGQFLPTNFPEDGVDLTITGSIPETEEERVNPLNIPRVSERMTLIDTDGRRALIKDDEGIYLIRPNSRLPGGSRVRMMLRKDGEVRLVTTDFEIIDKVN